MGGGLDAKLAGPLRPCDRGQGPAKDHDRVSRWVARRCGSPAKGPSWACMLAATGARSVRSSTSSAVRR